MQQFFTELIIREVDGVTYRYAKNDGWRTLGGTALAVHDFVRNEDCVHAVHLGFHGGKNCWYVEREHWSKSAIIPRDDHYGSLLEMMRLFEQLSGQRLQEVSVCDLGVGQHHVSAEGLRGGTLADPGNPWELKEGALYSLSPEGKEYRAVRVESASASRIELKPTSAAPDYPETFDPGLVMDLVIRARGSSAQFCQVEERSAPNAEAAGATEPGRTEDQEADAGEPAALRMRG